MQTELAQMTPGNALSFATDMIDAIPEPLCLYLSEPDILLPNHLWQSEMGSLNRLSALRGLAADFDMLAGWMGGCQFAEEPGQFCLRLDESDARRVIVSPVRGQRGLFVMLLQDDTEMRRVVQMRKDFIANVSHELRTPLTAVRGYVETLMDPAFFCIERVREFLPIIFEHTERLHNLMLDLLSLSRLENPTTHIDLSPVLLYDEIEDAVEFTATLAKMKNITVSLTPPAESVRVLANAEHIERVMVNLLDNAIKYSPPGGRVCVWTEIEGDDCWIHVTDEGQGIASEELPRIFERFYRTKGAMGGQARGCGLGLAIVKHIVQLLGGEIRVSSSLGKGSDFYFSLKLAHGRHGHDAASADS